MINDTYSSTEIRLDFTTKITLYVNFLLLIGGLNG